MNYSSLIRNVPDFPIPGVLFRDVSPLLQSAEAFSAITHDFEKMLDLSRIDIFVGIESRGFIFAAMLAAKLNKGFLPLRKAGKLPPPTIRESYKLEYGEATLEIAPSQYPLRVVICDDVLATGGTLRTSQSLCEKAGYSVEDMLVLINLTGLNQMKFKGEPIKSLIQY
ncbi:MAG: adenine phosphoribosyltransferase [Bdellovibrionales bacterium RIFCSPHIGHO2_01_FULL_40_29]|nr:MAG: adenine phosphoribosyltransferase [Bdellovibrionales bacterium RIFCSPHIGHO2_01_FULL_40_29]OFZ35463.1 MAG: adenine phosphoribosyltransferase [Bdellovibrionales bacterium RIFCSPHIGHO2_02_FULL_40_15]